jgi:hypothetical protein
VLALMAVNAAIAEVDDAPYYQLFGVVAVLDVLGIALQPVVRRLGAPPPAAAAEGPGGNRFVCVLADGRRVERDLGPDPPGAVADALRELRGRGERIARIEFGAG